jgi:hypothetical protein
MWQTEFPDFSCDTLGSLGVTAITDSRAAKNDILPKSNRRTPLDCDTAFATPLPQCCRFDANLRGANGSARKLQL